MKQKRMEDEEEAEEEEERSRRRKQERRRVREELNSFPARGDVKPAAQLQESRNGTDRQ